jgi:hypothetical protein
MTAVSWLENEFSKSYNKNGIVLFSQVFDMIKQAKAMEKEHLEDCWITAHQAGRFEGKGIAEEDWQTFFQYYNETYGK